LGAVTSALAEGLSMPLPIKTRDVAATIGVTIGALTHALRDGRVSAPQKDSSGDYVWTQEEISQAAAAIGRPEYAARSPENPDSDLASLWKKAFAQKPEKDRRATEHNLQQAILLTLQRIELGLSKHLGIDLEKEVPGPACAADLEGQLHEGHAD
jgi:hypothetical protein